MRNRIILGIACIFSFLMFVPLANAQIVEENHYKKFDHYLGYKPYIIKSYERDITVTIEDQFSTDEYLLAGSKGITHYNPAEKKRYDKEEYSKWYFPQVHLSGFNILRKSGSDKKRTVEVINQFGKFKVTVGSARRFLVPSIKKKFEAPKIRECTDEYCDGKLPEHVVNHYLCYNIDEMEGFTPMKVAVLDQFRKDFDDFYIMRPTLLCNPAKKKLDYDGAKWEPMKDRFNHLTCYGGGVKSRFEPVKFGVLNQLGGSFLYAGRDAGELCVPSLKREKVCGDGFLDEELGEECDDGNNDDGDGCNAECKIEFCGDDKVNNNNETCDPPGSQTPNPKELCRDDCTFCGDKIVDPGEECDDGANGDDADGCRDDCTVPVCGDKIKDPGEECDDGPDGSDTCRPDCTIPVCGDGIKDPGEQCDDGNNDDGDGCSAECDIEKPKTGACCVPSKTTNVSISYDCIDELTSQQCDDEGAGTFFLGIGTQCGPSVCENDK